MISSHPVSRLILLLSLLALVGCGGYDGSVKFTKSSTTVAEDLTREIPVLMERGHVPGVSALLMQDGEVVWSDHFGVRNSASGLPLGDDTLFQVTDLGKPVFAYLVLMLAERGVLDLDAPLAETLVYRRLAHEPRHAEITARQVLCHATGLPRRGGPTLELSFTPGNGFRYSTEAFLYLQWVVEKTMELPLEEIAREELFKPLGMNSSSFTMLLTSEMDLAAGHNLVGDPQREPANLEPGVSGSLVCTLGDYGRFLSAIVKGEGLSAEGRDLLFRAVNDTGSRDPHAEEAAIAWSLGWSIQRGERGELFWHVGDSGETKAFCVGSPVGGDVFLYFANSENGMSIAEDLTELVFRGPHTMFEFMQYDRWNEPVLQARNSVIFCFKERGLGAGIRRYEELRGLSPELLDEDQTNTLGYFLMELEMVSEAISIFQINTVNHPDSANTWDSLGEGYLEAEQLELSLENYRESLRLDPGNGNARTLINWIEVARNARLNPWRPNPYQIQEVMGNYGPLHVFYDNGGLSVMIDVTDEEFRMIPLSEGLYGFRGEPRIRLLFQRNGNGEVDRVTVIRAVGEPEVIGRTP